MTITHHLDEATLMSFAAGALPAALAAVAATHSAMCPRCRREMTALERVGGALMAMLPAAGPEGPEPLPPSPAGVPEPLHRQAQTGDGDVPWPAATLVGAGLDAVRWRRLGRGVWDHVLPLTGAGKLRLLKVAPGRGVPEHDHGGAELTLVLRGAFHDETGRYARGDVADLDEDVAHRPIADAGGDCICLVASEKPEHFRGLIARQWQRLRRI